MSCSSERVEILCLSSRRSISSLIPAKDSGISSECHSSLKYTGANLYVGQRCLRDIVLLMVDSNRVRIGLRQSVFVFSSGLLYLALMGATGLAQSYRGAALSVARRAVPVEFSRLRFLTL